MFNALGFKSVGHVYIIQGIRAMRKICFVYTLSEKISFNREERL